MTDAADIARAFNEWTPDRKDLEIATLRARVAELEGLIREFYEQWDGHPGCAGCDVAMDTIERLAGVANSVPTTDPRDARIAEVEQAAIQWRLRVAELETEAQESDARIAELEAALREMVSSFEHAAVDHLGDRPGFQDDALAAARRALGEETSGG